MKLSTILFYITNLSISIYSVSSHSIKLSHHPHKYQTQKHSSIDKSHYGYHANSKLSQSIKLNGGVLTLGSYYAQVKIGTPGITYNLLLDTGSSNLAVNSVACKTCGIGSGAAPYDPLNSSTYQPVLYKSQTCQICNNDPTQPYNCLYGYPVNNNGNCSASISYGGGSSYLVGTVVSETVEFLGLTAKDTMIIMLDSTYPSNSFTESPVDGIIGLASEHNAVVPSYLPTIFSNFVSSDQTENLFSICLTPSNGGVIDVGTIDSNKIGSPIEWVPIVQDYWYNLGLIDITVGGFSLNLPPIVYNTNNDQIGSFIDSGTSVILLGPVAYQNFQSLLQSRFSHLPGITGASNLFNGLTLTKAEMSSQLSSFPDLIFHITGSNDNLVQLTVLSSSYMMLTNGIYSLGVQTVPGIGCVLGDLLMTQYYIIHDKGNNRVGFSLLKENSCY